ncbi:MAG: site-specific integrase [Desulfoprunum sp.]
MRLGDRYLYLSRHNIFYFRIIVAVCDKDCNVKQEYRRSLKTRDPRFAKYIGGAMRVCFEEQGISGGLGIVEWEKVRKILDHKLLQLIAEEKAKVGKRGPYSIGAENEWKQLTLPNLQNALTKLGRERRSEADGQEIPLPQFLEEMVSSIFEEHEEPFQSDDQYLRVCEAVLQMIIQFTRERIKINREARFFPTNSEQKLVVQNDQDVIQSIKGTLLSKVVEEYCNEMMSGGNWTEKTHAEFRSAYDLFVKVVNDRPIAGVGYEESRYFKSTLQKLPSNMSKKILYRDKAIAEILTMKVPAEHLLSISKVNQYLSRVSSLFKWAQKQGHVSVNPFAGVKIKEKESDISKRWPFSGEDLTKLFLSKEYQQGGFKHPHYYWLPLLGLFTGARIEELCQLYLDDIYKKDGILVLDINSSHDKKVKTVSGQRVIPVHSRLIAFGIENYAATLRAKGEKRLFPELKKSRDGYSQGASKWFSRYRKRNGVVDPKTTFHSFRHTVVDHLKQKHIAKELIAAIVGHKDESITTGLYGKEYQPNTLQPIIEQLVFDVHVPPWGVA